MEVTTLVSYEGREEYGNVYMVMVCCPSISHLKNPIQQSIIIHEFSDQLLTREIIRLPKDVEEDGQRP